MERQVPKTGGEALTESGIVSTPNWLRAALGNAYFPDWTVDAACRKPVPDGQVRSIFFTDDMSSTEGIDKAKRAMAICVGCPVRLECIAYAYEEEAKDADPEELARPRRYGVFGGIPGRQREIFASRPDRIALGENWLAQVAETERWELKGATHERSTLAIRA